MVSTVYDGNTLVSVSYCERKLRELKSQCELVSMSLEDVERKRRLKEAILSYTKIKESLEKATVAEWISVVKTEMADKVKKARVSQKEIYFSYIDPCTIMLGIYNVFYTEITFNKTVYSVECVPNEYYDGYLDTFRDITVAKPTAFLEQFKAELENELGI